MPFKIERNDITKIRADAIVNTANPQPVIGRGTDTAVYEAAGRDELLESRRKIGEIKRGESAWTPAFKLKKNGVKYIIHTVGIHYEDGAHGEKEILRGCYSSALKLAVELKCKSVAIPLLASGNYGFPKELALQLAVEEISRFLLENEITVCLVVYDNEAYKISEKLFDDVEDFLSDNLEQTGNTPYILGAAQSASCCFGAAPEHLSKSRTKYKNAKSSRGMTFFEPEESKFEVFEDACAEKLIQTKEEAVAPADVDAFISTEKNTLNFQNTLQQLIADRKVENATIYKKACIDKKFFSKIISNKDYVPKKHTVMALGLALELPLKEYEAFLASAGYAFMPSSRFDLIIKYCVINQIYNIVRVDVILNDHGEECFAPA